MGLKSLISNLDSGKPFGGTYPNHNTPVNNAGFNYGQSVSIFDNKQSNNDYFPFRQRSLGYGPKGIKDSTGIFGRIHGPAPYIKQNLPPLDPNKRGPGDFGPDLSAVGAFDSVTDVGVRGGLITALRRSVTDSARIGEFMLSGKGLGFIAKNVGLQMTNPKLQEGSDKFGKNRVYNLGINTLSQVLTSATGLHVNRAGLLPVGKANYQVESGYNINTNNPTKYEFNVKGTSDGIMGGSGNITNDFDVYRGNRLSSLYNKLLGGLLPVGDTSTFENEHPDLYNFGGGPHSVYGLGKTRLKRYVFTNRDTLKAQREINKQKDGYLGSRHMGHRNGLPQETTNQVIDFRKFRGIPYTKYQQKIGEMGQSLEDKYGFPRGVTRRKTPTAETGEINVRSSHPLPDRINGADIYKHEGPFETTPLGKKSKDYIKFRIEAVNTDKPIESKTMVFRAFLDSMDDNYSSKWSEYSYNGRAESFYTFGSFNRGISFSFKVAAFSRDDMRPLYRKLNYLVSQTAGEYSDTRLRGNFCRLTIGDYHSRLPGFFTSISLKWDKEYPWEIALNQGGIGPKVTTTNMDHTAKPGESDRTGRDYELSALAQERRFQNSGGTREPLPPGQSYNIGGPPAPNEKSKYMDEDMLELPHMLDVSCKFQPVHDFIPQKSVTNSPFILPTKYSNKNLKEDQDWLKHPAVGDTGDYLEDNFHEIAAQEEKDIEQDYLDEIEQERLEIERQEQYEKSQAEGKMNQYLNGGVSPDGFDYGTMYPDKQFWIDDPDPEVDNGYEGEGTWHHKGKLQNPNWGEEMENRENFPDLFPDYVPGDTECIPGDYECRGYSFPWEDPDLPPSHKKAYIETLTNNGIDLKELLENEDVRW